MGKFDNAYRIYDDKYDSVKQRFVLKKISEDPEFKKDPLKNLNLFYTAIMRMELLMSGKLVVTDSQYYDGAMFHGLAEDKDAFNGFSNFLSDLEKRNGHSGSQPLFEVRRRGSHIKGIFGKEYRFSSIEDERLAASIQEKGKMLKDVSLNSMNEYLDIMQKLLKDEPGADKFPVFAERMERLEKLCTCAFHEWEDVPGVSNLKVIMKIHQENWLNKIEPWRVYAENEELKKKFTDMEAQLRKDFPNRSKVQDACKALSDLNKLDWYNIAQWNEFRNFYIEFNRRYNEGIANQHLCNIPDRAPEQYTQSGMLREFNRSVEMTCDMPHSLVHNMGGCTWEEFAENYFQEGMDLLRKDWLAKLGEYVLHRDKASGLLAKRSFDLLTIGIQKSFSNLRENQLEWYGCGFYNGEDDYFPKSGGLEVLIGDAAVGLFTEEQAKNIQGLYRIGDLTGKNKPYGTFLALGRQFGI